MVLTLRKWRKRFFDLLDSEAVAPLQAIFYVCFIIGGVYLLAFTRVPISGVENVIGPQVSVVWAWILIAGPVVWLGGCACRGSLLYHGWWAQLLGDLVTGGAVVIYVWSIVSDTPWGKGVFSPFIGAPTAICIALLTFRDVRRIVLVEKQVRR